MIKAVGRSLLLDFSFMTEHTFFFTFLRTRETATLNKKTQHCVGGISTKKNHLVFRFLPAWSLDMTCPLTSDRHFSSPRLRPCCLNKRVLTEANVTEHQRLDLRCWECAFRTNRKAQSGTVGSFHSKSWVLWTAWHSHCVFGNIKKHSVKIRQFWSFYVWYWKRWTQKVMWNVSLSKISFWTLANMQIPEVSVFGSLYCVFFLAFKRLEVFQLHQNFVNYLLNCLRKTFTPQQDQQNSFGVPSTPINFIEDHRRGNVWKVVGPGPTPGLPSRILGLVSASKVNKPNPCLFHLCALGNGCFC